MAALGKYCAITFAFFVAGNAPSFAADATPTTERSIPKIGDKLAPCKFTDIRYLPRTLNEFVSEKDPVRKRAFVLVFTNTTCPLVQKYLPRLKQLEAEFRDQGIQFVAVDVSADDSILEGQTKNDTIATAYATPVASSKPDITFAGLAICPEGDKDTYKIDVSVISDIEVITTWDAGNPVSVSILGAGGATLVNGTSNGANSLKAFAANQPMGTYYAQAYASATTKNNYKISLKVTPK